MKVRNRVRVVHYTDQLALGGTEKTMEIFCRHLDREVFDVHAVAGRPHRRPMQRLKAEVGAFLGIPKYLGKKQHFESLVAREATFREILGEDHLHIVADAPALRARLLLALAPDILHVHYAGRAGPPFSDPEALDAAGVVVTTNVFGFENTAPSHDRVRRIFMVSDWLRQDRAPWSHADPRVEVFYNPVETPLAADDLRPSLGIPADAFVVGRVGRPDNVIYDPISLRAYAAIQDGRTWFLALAAPTYMIRDARRMGLRNFLCLPPTTDRLWQSRFYNTIDVLAHARRDGETFGCNIAEAMMHGRPVVSHRSPVHNAQTEIIGDTGFVVGENDAAAYAEALGRLRADAGLRRRLGEAARGRAMALFEASALTRRLERTYLDLLGRAPAMDRPKQLASLP
ncbi:MAG: glycosyltransferase family 4 protein [Rhodospirillaceae bacterium]|nr:glycosyltransferase family 4 protein [Rhodospirillaceae bacterium]